MMNHVPRVVTCASFLDGATRCGTAQPPSAVVGYDAAGPRWPNGNCPVGNRRRGRCGRASFQADAVPCRCRRPRTNDASARRHGCPDRRSTGNSDGSRSCIAAALTSTTSTRPTRSDRGADSCSRAAAFGHGADNRNYAYYCCEARRSAQRSRSRTRSDTASR